MRLMAASVIIGIVIISFGLILNVLNRLRRGDRIGGCLGKFGLAGILFYWGMLALAVNYAAFQARGLVKLGLVLFFAVPLLSWLLKEPIQFFQSRHSAAPAHGLGVIVMESLVEVFEGLLSYFSNTISFVRLAAYAMSHAALLVATFMIAEDIRHFPHGGGLLSLGVIILGNAVALVLEGIVCSVQALRLEYYEFFGKFFSGGGQPFKPFRLQTTTVAVPPL